MAHIQVRRCTLALYRDYEVFLGSLLRVNYYMCSGNSYCVRPRAPPHPASNRFCVDLRRYTLAVQIA